jgi:hypothetical protein
MRNILKRKIRITKKGLLGEFERKTKGKKYGLKIPRGEFS